MDITVRDSREIKRLVFSDTRFFEVGGTVSKIIPYEENGEMATVTWFMIFSRDNNDVITRVNGKFVEQINYI